MLKIAVLASNQGRSLAGVQTAIQSGRLKARIELILSHQENPGIFSRARDWEIPYYFQPLEDKSQQAIDHELSAILKARQIELILLLGYKRILSPAFVTAWQGQILNIHPSLLPAFAGLFDEQVHRAVLESGQTESGCSIHWVTAELDAGPILWQSRCQVLAEDSVDSLKARVQALETEALVRCFEKLTALGTN